jgi:molybdopterin molybdotransferase
MRDIRRKGFLELISIEQALEKFFSSVRLIEPEVEEVGISDALGRVIAEDVHSEWDVPPFDRAAMDGYAVRSVDTVGASPTNPLVLRVIGLSEMGRHSDVTVQRFEAVRVSTGAPIPYGADSVIMTEYTHELDGERIEIYRSVTPYKNVSAQGEDVKKGERVLNKNTILQPYDIGILAAVRRGHIKVLKKLKIAVLSTGNELVDIHAEAAPGKIIDVNRYTLIASVKEIGCEPIDLGIATDSLENIKLKISEGSKSADIVVISGGISVGRKDLVSEAVNTLGKPGVVAHGISMRPSMPSGLAAVDNKPVILAPGNPVAAIIAFNTFVRPIVTKILGISTGHVKGQIIKARMTRKAPSQTGLRTFLRVVIGKGDEGFLAEPVTTSGAGIISSLVRADGIVIIPEWKEGLEQGEEVDVELLRPLER